MISESIATCRARTKIIILDCCHSGLFKGNDVITSIDSLAGTGRYILAAASPTNLAADSKEAGEPSPFTRVLTDGLKGRADDADRDGFIDLDDLFEYLRKTEYEGPAPHRKWDGQGMIVVARSRVHQQVSSPQDSEIHAVAVGKGSSASTVDRQDVPFIETLTGDTHHSDRLVQEFRQRLKAEVARNFPDSLSPSEFLTSSRLNA